MRIGFGYDLHRLEPGRPLILAGVTVPYELGLSGHSDADVVAHAVTDALLGAAALGNIGTHFPDTDARYRGVDSLALLQEAYGLIRQQGYRVSNVDVTVIAQAPALNPHTEAMRHNLAQCLEINPSAVSVKPKTNEGVGPEGLGEAISAHAVALIDRAQ